MTVKFNPLTGNLDIIDDPVERYSSLATFPSTGESGKLYIALDSNQVYTWTSTSYAALNASAGSSVGSNLYLSSFYV